MPLDTAVFRHMTQMACASDVHVERAGSAHLTGWRICLPSFPPSYAHGLPGRSKGRRGVKVVNGGRQKTSRKAVVGPCTSACIMQAFAVRIPIASTGRPGRGVALCRAFGWIPIVGAQVSRSSPFVQRWGRHGSSCLDPPDRPTTVGGGASTGPAACHGVRPLSIPRRQAIVPLARGSLLQIFKVCPLAFFALSLQKYTHTHPLYL